MSNWFQHDNLAITTEQKEIIPKCKFQDKALHKAMPCRVPNYHQKFSDTEIGFLSASKFDHFVSANILLLGKTSNLIGNTIDSRH